MSKDIFLRPNGETVMLPWHTHVGTDGLGILIGGDRGLDCGLCQTEEIQRLRAALERFADAERWREDLVEGPDGLEPTGSYVWDVEDVAPWKLAQDALNDAH